MSETARNARQVIHSLRGYEARVQEVTRLLDGKHADSDSETAQLQDLIKNLRDDLVMAAQRVSSARVEAGLNAVERVFFAPAVIKAAAILTISVSSQPTKSHWLSALTSIRMDVVHRLRQLEMMYPDS